MSTHEPARCTTFEQTIGSAAVKYVRLAADQLVGILCVLYVKEEIRTRVTAPEIVQARTGLKGIAGNKGGVSIRVCIDDTSVTFVGVHMAAGQKDVAARNQDYKTIVKYTHFAAEPTGILNSDVVFWFGDMNYRIGQKTTISSEEIKAKVEAADYRSLHVHDQLLQEKAALRAFQGFKEGTLNFAPSYKCDRL